MKTKFYSFRLLLLTTLIAGIMPVANAQDMYWREGFNAAGASTNPGDANVVTTYTGDVGEWRFYGVYRTTGTACIDPANWHIRNVNNTTIADTPYVLTPLVNAGISKVHLQRGRNNRRIVFYTTNDPSPTTTNWTLANGILKVVGFPNPLCLDTAVMINAPDAVRMKIVFEIGTNNDVDSIALFSSRPLPVKFTGVNAASVNGLNKITWNIATELNTYSYIVEKSTNGTSFTAVSEVLASNSGSYSWIDNSASNGTVYYRIKAKDKDGKLTYSGIVRISVNSQRPEFLITPTVLPGRVLNMQLNNVEKGNVTLRISNNLGQVVYSASLINEGGAVSKTIALPGTLQAGTYRVQIVSGKTIMTQTAVLQ